MAEITRLEDLLAAVKKVLDERSYPYRQQDLENYCNWTFWAYSKDRTRLEPQKVAESFINKVENDLYKQDQEKEQEEFNADASD